MSSKASFSDKPVLYFGIFLFLVALLLALQTKQRIDSHWKYHQTLATNTVDILSSEIIEKIRQKRRLLRLFAEFEAGFLSSLVQAPKSPSLSKELESRIHGYFPNAITFTIASPIGELLINNGNDLIDERCRHDIFDFAAGLEPLSQIHSNPWAYHYDLMVRMRAPEGYVLFVSFSTSELVTLLQNSHRPGHQLLLMNEEAEGLIEISEQGDRQALLDPSASVMDRETRQRILGEKPIPNTRWRLVDVSTPELFPEHQLQSTTQSLFIFALFLISSLIGNRLIQRSQRQKRLAEEELRAAKDRLEIEVKAQLEELKESEDLAEITLSSLSEGVITTNLSGQITALNRQARELTGLDAQHYLLQPLCELLSLETIENRETIPLAEHDCLDSEKIESLNREPLRLKRQDGSRRVVQLSVSPIKGRRGAAEGNVLVIRDVTESYLLSHRISWQATHDALTGLINRLEFETRLQDALERTRTDRAGHVLMYLDLDQFKVVNDTCGHGAGDELLRQAASLIKHTIRSSDLLARIGGDEFAILLCSCALEVAQRIAENIRLEFQRFRFAWADKVFSQSISIGLVAIDKESQGLQQVLSYADTACFAAKEAGRNQIHVYHPEKSVAAVRHGEVQWVTRIRSALEEDRFTLYAQPIKPLESVTGAPPHYEVLLRMIGEEGELIPPGAFIPAAERYDLMPAIDRWVVEHLVACVSRRNCRMQPGQRLFVNLSGQSLCRAESLQAMVDLLSRHPDIGGLFCFEVTETAAIGNLSSARYFMQTLKRFGCQFALDDFGSGLSSFGYLKNMPVEYLKIDGGFVKDMLHDRIDESMVEAINHIGHIMGLETIAECVEDFATLARLVDIGVDYAQGFGIRRPFPLDELTRADS